MGKQAGVDLNYAFGAVFYSDKSNLNYISHNASLDAKYLTSAHINFYLKESFILSDNPYEREFFTTTEENKFMPGTTTERSPYWRNVVAPKIEYQFGPETGWASTTEIISIKRRAYTTRTAGRIISIHSLLTGLTDKMESLSNTASRMGISKLIRT